MPSNNNDKDDIFNESKYITISSIGIYLVIAIYFFIKFMKLNTLNIVFGIFLSVIKSIFWPILYFYFF
jgi:hypothetical protein